MAEERCSHCLVGFEGWVGRWVVPVGVILVAVVVKGGMVSSLASSSSLVEASALSDRSSFRSGGTDRMRGVVEWVWFC